MLPIIDTHQHLWDLSKFDLPWTASVDIFNRSYVMSDYFAATEGLNVVKTVYMEVDVSSDQQVAEANYVIDLSQAADNPMAGAVISGRPAEAGFQAYIDQFKDNPYIKGVRQVLHVPETPAGYCLNETFVKSVQYLGQNDLSFDICMRPDELSDAAKLVDQCPDTQFILDHCGNADPNIISGKVEPDAATTDATYVHTKQQWLDDMAALAERPNIVCKISGIIARVSPGWTPADLAPTINHCLDQFGPERIVFGGDWPVCILGATYPEWVNALKTVIQDRPEAQQRQLLHDNAARIYGVG